MIQREKLLIIVMKELNTINLNKIFQSAINKVLMIVKQAIFHRE